MEISTEPSAVSYADKSLHSLFSLLCFKQQLSREVIFLCSKLISGIASQYTANEVYVAIFQHPGSYRHFANTFRIQIFSSESFYIL